MLARMIRKVRPAQDFQDQMEKVFEVCMTALTDSVGWNDAFSFYILSNVLMCLPGLERDALISISLQVSLVDAALSMRGHSSNEDGSGDEADDEAEGQAKNEAVHEAPNSLSPHQEMTMPPMTANPHDQTPQPGEVG